MNSYKMIQRVGAPQLQEWQKEYIIKHHTTLSGWQMAKNIQSSYLKVYDFMKKNELPMIKFRDVKGKAAEVTEGEYFNPSERGNWLV